MAAAAASSSSSLSLSLDSILSSSHRRRLSSSLRPSHVPIKSSQTPSTTAGTQTTTTTFLDPVSIHRLHTLNSFHLTHHFPYGGGSLQIRPMGPNEVDPAVALLANSFADALWMPAGYVRLLEFLVKQYVMERRGLVPHAVMLVGFYQEDDEKEAELACTAEVSFDARGANAAPPTPLPPRNCPYICNMTVKKKFRR